MQSNFVITSFEMYSCSLPIGGDRPVRHQHGQLNASLEMVRSVFHVYLLLANSNICDIIYSPFLINVLTKCCVKSKIFTVQLILLHLLAVLHFLKF